MAESRLPPGEWLPDGAVDRWQAVSIEMDLHLLHFFGGILLWFLLVFFLFLLTW
jgi:hypothetical protein